jgi:TatD DNase family protein
MLIDTHTHLYVKKFDQDRDAMLARAISNGVERMYLPAIDAETHDAMLDLERKYPKNCFAMMGLHPCSVTENFEEELKIVEKHLGERPFCAVGEMGIDLYWDKAFFEQQKEAFRRQTNWAKSLNIPIVIHARESIDICIELVRELQDGNLSGIFHCFTGSVEQGRQIIDLGFHLGIGGVLTYPNGGLDVVCAELPLESMVLETDSPYLPPVPYRGKRNESAYIRHVAERLSELKIKPLKEIARVTSENALKIFKTENA